MARNIVLGTDDRDWIFTGRSDDHIVAGAGADFIRSGGGNDLIEAGDGRDFILAGSGDDIVDTGAGNDFADGGRGTDTARFAGNFTDYKITVFGRLIFVEDMTTGERDTLTNFELLQFAEGVYDPRAANNSPLADDIAATFVQGDAPLTLNLLAEANAFDFDGDTIEVASVETNARLAFDPATGLVTYDPGDGFGNLGANETRLDSFTFDLTDGTETISRTIEFTVQGVNDLPTGAVLVAGEVKEGETLTADVSGLDDPDGLGVLSYQWQSSSDGGANWTDIAGATGETFAPGESEVDKTVRVVVSYTDDGGTGEEVESGATDPVAPANATPIAVDDQFTVTDDFTVLMLDVLANDSDSDFDPLTIIDVEIVSDTEELGVGVFGDQLLIQPRFPTTLGFLQDGETEIIELRYTVSDGNGGEAEANVEIVVEGTDQAPVRLPLRFLQSVEEDSGVVPVNLTSGFVDPEGGGLSLVSVTLPSGIDVSEIGVLDGNRLLIDTGAEIFQGLGPLQSIELSSEVVVADSTGLETRGISAQTILVTGVNDAPVAVDDAFSIAAGETLVGDLLADNGAGADSDVEGDPLTITAIDGDAAAVGEIIALASGAALTVNPDGTFSYDPNGAFDDLGPGQTDTDVFTYTVADGNDGFDTATVTVGVTAPDDGATIQLADLDGTNGFVMNGADISPVRGESTGFAVAGAGDVNGDGFADVLLGAPTADSPSGLPFAGAAFVVFGGVDPAPTGSFDLAALDGGNGFGITLEASLLSRVGWSVSAGDINGDGQDDVLLGAPLAQRTVGPSDDDIFGQAYVVFGRESGFPASLDATNDSATEFTGRSDSGTGSGVAVVGDVDGDGRDDILIGTAFEGAAYLISGDNLPAFASLSDPAFENGPSGVRLAGDNFPARLYVSSAGDFNGDGLADAVLQLEQSAAIIFGDPSIFAAGSIDLDNLGNAGIRVVGFLQGSPGPVALAGDVNRDGRSDVAIAAKVADGSGVVHVAYGTPAGIDINVAGGLVGENGFDIIGIDAALIDDISVAGAGDMNGDGYDDVIIGLPGAPGGGAAYVIYGDASGRANVDITELDGTTGFVIQGPSDVNRDGFSVAGAGDINGDGFDDVIVGSPGPEELTRNSDPGKAYVVYGGNFTGDVDLLGTLGSEPLVGGDGDEVILGANGNDTIDAGAGDDVLKGGGGNDRLIGGPGDDTYDGGWGADVFVLTDESAPQVDRLLDFEPGVDLIEVSGFAGLTFDTLDSNGDGFLNDADDRIFLPFGFFTIDLGDAQFVFVPGVSQLTDADLVFV